jgi:NAD(P)-dependent dehydrogenase (short-subunit alcohol dehydrogenase family)
MRIEGSVAIVTGGGSGIGLALAESLAAAGARVVVSDINALSAQYAAEKIAATGNIAIARQADACLAADIRGLRDDAASQFGPVDIYVANAGIAGPPGLGWHDGQWEQALEVNLRAHVRAATVLVPDWINRGSGHFVSVASAAGLLTQIGAAAYAVTKHAAVAFAEWLAITYGEEGIRVSCVCPMGVNTPLLNSTRGSPDPSDQLMASAIINAGEVIEPRLVADATLDAIRQENFLALPHPQVRTLLHDKAADPDRWVMAMRRYQQSLATRSGPQLSRQWPQLRSNRP